MGVQTIPQDSELDKVGWRKGFSNHPGYLEWEATRCRRGNVRQLDRQPQEVMQQQVMQQEVVPHLTCTTALAQPTGFPALPTGVTSTPMVGTSSSPGILLPAEFSECNTGIQHRQASVVLCCLK